MPLYNNVIRNLDKEDRKDEDKLGYEFWEGVENLPVIKQIGQYNKWSAENRQAVEERARSGELGGFNKALQIGSDVGSAVVGAPFQLIDQGLEAISDAANIDRRSIDAGITTALTLANVKGSKSASFKRGHKLKKTLEKGKTKRTNVGQPANLQTIDIEAEQILNMHPTQYRRVLAIYRNHEGGISWKQAMAMARLPQGTGPNDPKVYIPPNERIGTQKGDPLQSVNPEKEKFNQLVMSLDQEGPVQYNFPTNKPTPFVSEELGEELGPDGNRLEGLTTQEIQSLGPAVKSYMKKRAYKDAGTTEGYTRMTLEVEKAFEDLLGPDFDRDLVRGYMKAVADHESALTELQKIMNDETGKLWDKQHANALRNLEHSGRMLGNKGLFPAFNYPDELDQTPLGRSKVKIEREGNRPDPRARGADFQHTLMRVLGKPLSLQESILYWYDQDMFYFWKELSPLQRQQLVDSSRTRSGGRIKSELTVAENINQALESMQFGEETMSGKLGRKMNPQERLESLVDNATANLLRTRKYKGLDKNSPLQGNVFYDIQTGKETDYRPDLTGKGAYWDIESE